MRLPCLPALSAVLILAGSGALIAQEPPRFSAATDLVVLNVRVSDRKGLHVAGLRQEAFTVFEDGQKQNIHLFSMEDAPVTVGLIIDSSISMWSIRDLLVESAVAFAEASNPSDEMFAIAFNERIRPALPTDEPFTGSPAILGAALAGVIQPRGRTALFDAVQAGLDYVERGSHARRVLTVISDGGDNASTGNLADLVARTQASNVVIYTVALIDPVEPRASSTVLKQIAEVSGGEIFRPRTVPEVRGVVREIAREVRHGYTVGYVPSRPLDGNYHRVRVVVSAPGRGPVVAKTRSGYLRSLESARSGGDAH